MLKRQREEGDKKNGGPLNSEGKEIPKRVKIEHFPFNDLPDMVIVFIVQCVFLILIVCGGNAN